MRIDSEITMKILKPTIKTGLTVLVVFAQLGAAIPVLINSVAAQEVNLIDTPGIENPNLMYERVDEVGLSLRTSTAQSFSKNFESPIEAFKLNILDESITFDQLTLNVQLASGEEVEGILVHEADNYYGDEGYANTFSQLYTFDSKISSVDIFGGTESQIGIELVTSEISEDRLLASTVVDPEDSQFRDMETKKQFYKNLGVNVITREEWGAPSTSIWKPQVVSDVNTIVVHHTATTVDNVDPGNTVRLIYNEHKNRCSPYTPDCSAKWNDIGYNYLIDQYGNIYEGRVGGNGVIAAHSPPNSGTIGIAVLGNYSGYTPESKSQRALEKLMARLAVLNDIRLEWGNTVLGHRHRQNTACPGEKLYELMPFLTGTAYKLQKTNDKLKQIYNQVDVMASTDSVVTSDNKVEVILDKDGLSSSMLDQIERYTKNVSDFREFGSRILFNVDEQYLEKVLRENKVLLDNEIKIQPNFIYETAAWNNSDPDRAVPDDYDSGEHWYLNKINMLETWSDLGGCASDDSCGGDPSTIVAVLDTGVAYEDYDYDAGSSYSEQDIFGFNIEVPGGAANGTYNEGYDRSFSQAPELAGVNFVSPYDVVQDYFCFLRDFTAFTCNATELEKVNHANDDDGHGTFVTGLIAGDTGDTDDNLVGIAHNVSIMPVDVFLPNDSSMGDDRVLSTSLFLETGIDYAVANGADVINMSISGGSYDQFLQDAITNAADNKVIVVAASGNTGAQNADTMFPGAYDDIIVVGASTQADGKASYSSYGTSIDVAAPVDSGIASQWYVCSFSDTCYREDLGNQFDESTDFTSETTPITVSGTSFAAPQVAAVIALLKEQYPNMSFFEIEWTLYTQSSYNGTRNNNLGYGIIDAERILKFPWTKPSTRQVFRFFNTNTGTHFYTASTTERDKVIETLTNLNYEGVSFNIHKQEDFKMVPVYRFFNTERGVHFYTASESEKNKVINTLPTYVFEGVAYYVYNEPNPYTKPIYRFFNNNTGVHLYTSSESEKNKVINTLPDYVFEGIGYYATN
jgi:subtilisin family serine protease